MCRTKFVDDPTNLMFAVEHLEIDNFGRHLGKEVTCHVFKAENQFELTKWLAGIENQL